MTIRGNAGVLSHIAAWVLLGALAAMGAAQETGGAAVQIAETSGGAGQQAAQQPGNVSGTVIDSDGDAIAGAQVTLSSENLKVELKLIADGKGYFSFVGVPVGKFNLAIAYTGFSTAVKPVTVHEAEDVAIPDIVLPVAGAEMDVEVSPHAQYEHAELDMKAEEKQRLGGIVPNFYVTYDWHAPPLTTGQKFRLAFRATIDPANFALDAGIAGIGRVTAARLITRHGAIEDFPPEVLGAQRPLALLFKDLATLRCDAALYGSVDELRWRGPTASFAALAPRLGGERLLLRAQRAAATLSGD